MIDQDERTHPAWYERAVCIGQPLYLFYGPTQEGTGRKWTEAPAAQQLREREALELCGACPVRAACLAEQLALPAGLQFGISGGMTEQERRALIIRGSHLPPARRRTLVRGRRSPSPAG